MLSGFLLQSAQTHKENREKLIQKIDGIYTTWAGREEKSAENVLKGALTALFNCRSLLQDPNFPQYPGHFGFDDFEELNHFGFTRVYFLSYRKRVFDNQYTRGDRVSFLRFGLEAEPENMIQWILEWNEETLNNAQSNEEVKTNYLKYFELLKAEMITYLNEKYCEDDYALFQKLHDKIVTHFNDNHGKIQNLRMLDALMKQSATTFIPLSTVHHYTSSRGPDTPRPHHGKSVESPHRPRSSSKLKESAGIELDKENDKKKDKHKKHHKKTHKKAKPTSPH